MGVWQRVEMGLEGKLVSFVDFSVGYWFGSLQCLVDTGTVTVGCFMHLRWRIRIFI